MRWLWKKQYRKRKLSHSQNIEPWLLYWILTVRIYLLVALNLKFLQFSFFHSNKINNPYIHFFNLLFNQLEILLKNFKIFVKLFVYIYYIFTGFERIMNDDDLIKKLIAWNVVQKVYLKIHPDFKDH